MENILIDFNKPSFAGNELTYITQAIDNLHISGDGYFTKQCQSLIEKELGVNKVLLTTSCTHALEMVAFLSVFHYQSLHMSKMGRQFGGQNGDCPVTEYVSDRLLRLPFYNSLTEEDQQIVIDTIQDFNF